MGAIEGPSTASVLERALKTLDVLVAADVEYASVVLELNGRAAVERHVHETTRSVADMAREDFAAAAADFAHVLTMLTVVAGPESDELIRPAEQPCHARVMLGQWAGARDALSRARQLCALRYGADHPDTRRLDHVIRGIREQMSANDAETAKAAAQVEGLAS